MEGGKEITGEKGEGKEEDNVKRKDGGQWKRREREGKEEGKGGRRRGGGGRKEEGEEGGRRKDGGQRKGKGRKEGEGGRLSYVGNEIKRQEAADPTQRGKYGPAGYPRRRAASLDYFPHTRLYM
jgi:hypothetical protein